MPSGSLEIATCGEQPSAECSTEPPRSCPIIKATHLGDRLSYRPTPCAREALEVDTSSIETLPAANRRSESNIDDSPSMDCLYSSVATQLSPLKFHKRTTTSPTTASSTKSDDLPASRYRLKENNFGQVSDDMIIHVVRSLYDDGIRPGMTDVWHRLREMLSSSGLSTCPDKEQLKQQCKRIPKFYITVDTVEKEKGSQQGRGQSEPFVYLVTEPDDFQGWVDPRSVEDPFSVEVWRHFILSVSSLLSANNSVPRRGDPSLLMYQFKGGRYGLALELKELTPSFRKRRLGELCHLTQLAISRGILCYERSVLQPVASCMDRTRAYLRAADKVAAEPLEEADINDKLSTNNNSLGNESNFSLQQIARMTTTLLVSQTLGCELAEVSRGLQCRFSVGLQPEMFGKNKMIDVFLLEEMQIHFRLFCTSNTRHKVIIQLRRFPPPMWAYIIDKKSKKMAQPLPHEVWEIPIIMSRLSFNFEKFDCPKTISEIPSPPPQSCPRKDLLGMVEANKRSNNKPINSILPDIVSLNGLVLSSGIQSTTDLLSELEWESASDNSMLEETSYMCETKQMVIELTECVSDEEFSS
eukprot:GHVP01056315.1.p1 GENE.GHVP01056315.1~~GHVP01056315.1.p1  ORF type:complete len:583 (-),score=78.51 GHVP01056315.1:164-1912(-)